MTAAQSQKRKNTAATYTCINYRNYFPEKANNQTINIYIYI